MREEVRKIDEKLKRPQIFPYGILRSDLYGGVLNLIYDMLFDDREGAEHIPKL
ncbi:SubName: Full=Uncharacterized protein {ECO:0000313/EMBL:CCA74637.1} [Serendipita indica DSM 11827]|nr:SubName: Full=Uncharacterized protein {ECO:0000313/EMBL:CCA74637.1} [Serendipita indica DSM 11827]